MWASKTGLKAGGRIAECCGQLTCVRTAECNGPDELAMRSSDSGTYSSWKNQRWFAALRSSVQNYIICSSTEFVFRGALESQLGGGSAQRYELVGNTSMSRSCREVGPDVGPSEEPLCQ